MYPTAPSAGHCSPLAPVRARQLLPHVPRRVLINRNAATCAGLRDKCHIRSGWSMGLGRGPLLRAMSSLPTSSAVNAKASAAPASSVGRAETAGTVIPARAARRCNCAATDSAGWPNETPSSADGTPAVSPSGEAAKGEPSNSGSAAEPCGEHGRPAAPLLTLARYRHPFHRPQETTAANLRLGQYRTDNLRAPGQQLGVTQRLPAEAAARGPGLRHRYEHGPHGRLEQRLGVQPLNAHDP